MEGVNRIVSSEAEELILVDADDNETGFLSKAECHDGDGQLHRAFSLFLFDDQGRLLLQQRAGSKRLWPGYWSNTCCSHPRRGETLEVATRRRLRDELNIEVPVELIYRFCYQAKYGNVGSENESCHVYLGRVQETVVPNDHEIAAIRFVSPSGLSDEMDSNPDRFTPWLRMEWRELTTGHRNRLARYCTI